MDLDRLALPGRHQPLFARNGMVTTSQPLAAAAGVQVLQAGGTAADAAIATAAALTVVEPCSNGLGSDAFAIVWDGHRLHGLNGSGRAPAAASPQRIREAGHQSVPLHGWDAVTVPGAVAAWRDLHAKFGRLPFARLLEPAITYAEDGFPVSPVVAWGWQRGIAAAMRDRNASGTDQFLATFAPGGAAPRPGSVIRLPRHADALRALADSGGADLYTGRLAERIAAHSAATGGFLTAADLAAHTSTWVDPISTAYRGLELWEIPPNGQGIAALVALAILEGLEIDDPLHPDAIHLAIEATKIGLSDAHAFVTDPDAGPTPDLLDPAYIADRRAALGPRALTAAPGIPPGSDTVYLAAADGEGHMVSFIQSNFHGFGSRVVVDGVALQNRGSGFSLDPRHPNVLAPSKRPFHTIIPGFLTRGGAPIGPLGVMGGHMQAQGHVQVTLAAAEGDDPATALDRPRWHWEAGRRVLVESPAGAPRWPQASGDDGAAALVRDLTSRGHEVEIAPNSGVFGRGQLIWRAEGGVLVGASDPRADGIPMGW